MLLSKELIQSYLDLNPEALYRIQQVNIAL